jgi:NDP-sugar pyrophosphorylase family protein
VSAARFLERFLDRNEWCAGFSAGIYLTKHGMNRSSKVVQLNRIVWQFYIARQTQSIPNRISFAAFRPLICGVRQMELRPSRRATLWAMADSIATTISTAILLAAGRGTRLGDITATLPKPLLDIAGEPLIEHIVDGLAAAGVNRFILVTGYLASKIEDWAKMYARQNPKLKIGTVRQPDLNGTAGAMLAVRHLVSSEARFVFAWGDILLDGRNYARFIKSARTDDFDLMLAVNRVLDPYRGAAVYLHESMRVKKLVEKPERGTSQTHWNNAGLFASSNLIFEYLEKLAPSPRGEIELPAAIAQMIDDGRIVRAIDIRGFWNDVGTPEDLETARRKYQSAPTTR